MKTAQTQATAHLAPNVAPEPSVYIRLLSLSMAAVLTLALLAGVEGLATAGTHAPVMAQASSTQG
jgi:hypothetical protein